MILLAKVEYSTINTKDAFFRERRTEIYSNTKSGHNSLLLVWLMEVPLFVLTNQISVICPISFRAYVRLKHKRIMRICEFKGFRLTEKLDPKTVVAFENIGL